MIIDALSWFLLVSGSVFCIISAIGVLRLPDYFSRIHAAGILDSTGTGALILGLMLQGGAEEYAESAPWVPIFPGLAITLAVFGFNLFGDSVRDTLDPRLRSQ